MSLYKLYCMFYGIVIILIPIECLSQIEKYIIIVDSTNNEPIKNVTLVYDVYDDNNKVLSGFSISDQMGLVKIINKPNYIITMEVRHISYLTINKTCKIGYLLDTIRMLPSEIKLNEVVVKYKDDYKSKRIKTFVVDSYQTVTTRKVSQLISRTPGFEINDRNIFYRGDAIETVLIDSMDIAGQQYMNVVNTLPTAQFSQFQVIRDYHKNPVDKGFKKGVLALNVKSSDLSRIHVGLGGSQGIDSKGKSDFDVDIFANTKAVKVLAFGKRRQIETGYLSFRELENGPSYRVSNFGRSEWNNDIDRERPYIPLEDFSTWCYDEIYYGSKIQAGLQSKGQGLHNVVIHYGNNDYKHRELLYFEQNFLEGYWQYSTDSEYKLRNNLFGLEYDFEKPGESSFVHYGGYYIVPSFTSSYKAQQSGDLIGELVHQIQGEPELSGGAYFDYSRKAGQMGKHQVKATLDLVNQEIFFYPDSNRIMNFFPGVSMLSERFFMKHKDWRLSYYYTRMLSNYSLEVGGQMNIKSLHKANSWSRLHEADTLENNTQSRLQKAQLAIKLYPKNTLNMRHWISMNIEGGYSGLDLDQQFNSSYQSIIPLDLKVKLGKRINDWNVLSLQYHYKSTFPELKYNYPSFTVNSNYYRFTTLKSWSKISDHDINLSYKTGGWADLTSLQLTLGYLHKPKDLTESIFLNIDYAVQSFYYAPHDQLYWNGSFKGLLINLPISYEVKLTASYAKYMSMVNDREQPFKNYLLHPGIGMTIETKNLNIRFAGDVNYTISEADNSGKYSNTRTYFGCDLEFNSTDNNWKFQWDNRLRFKDFDVLQFPGGKMTLTRYFIGFDISCWIDNLYNANYGIIDISPLTRSSYTIPLNPRSLGIRLRWDI